MASVLEHMLSTDAGREWLRRRGYVGAEQQPSGDAAPYEAPPPPDLSAAKLPDFSGLADVQQGESPSEQLAAQNPPAPQMQQVEAKDESQGNAPGVGEAVPQAPMEPAPYESTTPPPAVQAQPATPQPQEPSFNETAARLALEGARRRDAEQRSYWELGEGLKQAMGTFAGRPYSPRPFTGDEGGIVAESQQSQRQQALQAYQRAQAAKAEQRQGRLDEEMAGVHEATRIKDLAEAAKAAREPVATAPKNDPKAYKQSMKADPLLLQQFHGDQKKLNAWVDSQADDEKALSDAAAGIRGQSKGVNVAVVTEKLGEQKQTHEQMEE